MSASHSGVPLVARMRQPKRAPCLLVASAMPDLFFMSLTVKKLGASSTQTARVPTARSDQSNPDGNKNEPNPPTIAEAPNQSGESPDCKWNLPYEFQAHLSKIAEKKYRSSMNFTLLPLAGF